MNCAPVRYSRYMQSSAGCRCRVARLTYAAAGYKQLLQLYVDITVDIVDTVDTVDISTRRRPGSGKLEIIA